MKCYIILGTFFDMGGGQLYTRNKVNYLKKQGWKVFIYTGRSGTLYIKDLEEYRNNYIKELNSLPFYFKQQIIDRVLTRIADECNGTWDCVVVETHKQPMAIWGEMLAQRINGKHLFFDLDEDFKRFEDWYYQYLDFKHNRKELAGINKLSLQKMFKEHKKISDDNNYHLVFPATNSVENVRNSLIENSQTADITLGSISRLDKDYLIPMMNEIVIFCREHPQKRINLFVVGGAKDSAYSEKIVEIGAEADNLTVIMLGYLSPIPRTLVDKVDIFIGTAASAVMTAEYGKVTVAVDTLSCEPIGIMGINANSTTFSDGKQKWKTLSSYLDYIIFDETIQTLESQIRNDCFMGIDNEKMMDEHMEFLNNSNPSHVYYEFKNLGGIYELEYFVIRCIGINNARKIKKLLRK